MWFPKMQQVHLNVDERERDTKGDYRYGLQPQIDEETIRSMEPSKLLEIATSLGVVGDVLNALKTAQDNGHDVSHALAILSPRIAQSEFPWGQ